MRGLFPILLCFGLAAGLWAQETPAGEESRVRFRAVDIYLDSKGSPLAAYQVEFAVTNGVAKIAGIEGGEHAQFKNPPFYDLKAIRHERVVIASFSTAKASDLPTGKTRIATIHLELRGTQAPEYRLHVQTAGDPSAKNIKVEASLKERTAE